MCNHFFKCPPPEFGVANVVVKCKLCGEEKSLMTLRGYDVKYTDSFRKGNQTATYPLS